jgi:hypothetical protein
MRGGNQALSLHAGGEELRRFNRPQTIGRGSESVVGPLVGPSTATPLIRCRVRPLH